VRELLEDDRRAFVEQTRAEQRKQVYYMSMEFLVGTSLRNNLYNMGLLEPAGEILHDLGFSLESLCALEPDAARVCSTNARRSSSRSSRTATHTARYTCFSVAISSEQPNSRSQHSCKC